MAKHSSRFLLLSLCLILAVQLNSCGTSVNNLGNPPPQNPGTTPTSPNIPANVTVTIPAGATGKGVAAYGANPLQIGVGTTVTWTNQDSMPHTATSDTRVWDSGTLQTGQSFSFQFKKVGGFPYHCSIHGVASMSGMIEVVSPSTQPSPTPSPSSTLATYSQVNSDVLLPHCIICHSGARPSAGLDFTTYENLVHNPVMPNLIVPGNPNRSALYLDIEGGTAPGSTEHLTQAQIQLVFDWIKNGALKD